MRCTYQILLFPVLALSDLRIALLVEVGSLDLGLELLELVGISAYLLDLPSFPLVGDLHTRHFLSELLFHGVEVDGGIVLLEDLLVYGVESS